jgi:hypothetical protein
MKDYISRLEEAIRDLHGCESHYVETVTVKEVFQGEVVWWGEVEVFEICDHPSARRAYAWSHWMRTSDRGTTYLIVLECHPYSLHKMPFEQR